MNILFTICGRAGSKGLKNKNLLSLNEYPLIYYSLSLIDLYINRHQHESVEIDIALSTDSHELHNLCDQTKVTVHHIQRPIELSDDITPKVLVIQHAQKLMEQIKRTSYDLIIDLDITSPIRRLNDLENVIQTYHSQPCDVVFTVTHSRRNPYFNMVKLNSDGFYERVISSQFTTRQQAPKIYDMNASIYAFRPEFLLTTKSIFSGKCLIVEMEDTAILDIDEQEDLLLLAVISKHLCTKDLLWNQVVQHIQLIYK